MLQVTLQEMQAFSSEASSRHLSEEISAFSSGHLLWVILGFWPQAFYTCPDSFGQSAAVAEALLLQLDRTYSLCSSPSLPVSMAEVRESIWQSSEDDLIEVGRSSAVALLGIGILIVLRLKREERDRWVVEGEEKWCH